MWGFSPAILPLVYLDGTLNWSFWYLYPLWLLYWYEPFVMLEIAVLKYILCYQDCNWLNSYCHSPNTILYNKLEISKQWNIVCLLLSGSQMAQLLHQVSRHQDPEQGDDPQPSTTKVPNTWERTQTNRGSWWGWYASLADASNSYYALHSSPTTTTVTTASHSCWQCHLCTCRDRHRQ